MFKYILTRILYFIPTLLIITLLTFLLSQAAPGDPVETRLQGGQGAQGGGMSEKQAGEQAYIDMSKKLGLDLPPFYFSLGSIAEPKDLYKIFRKKERENLARLINEYGNWDRIEPYYESIKAFEVSLYDIERDTNSYTDLKILKEGINNLLNTYEEGKVSNTLSNMEQAMNTVSKLRIDSNTIIEKNYFESSIPAFTAMRDNYLAIKANPSVWKTNIPSIKWIGTGNQYHVWLFGNKPWFSKSKDPSLKGGFIRGDFGESYLDGRPVSSIIKDALPITMSLNIISVLIAYSLSVWLGVFLSKRKDSKLDRVVSIVLFILYSLPVFWVATIFIVYLTTNEYGMDWFPTYGLFSNDLSDDATFWEVAKDGGAHVILPILAMTYGSFTYITRQMRGSMLAVLKQDYIRTAVAKGLPDNKVTWKHAFRNSLIPVITMFASLFPVMISGSVVIEVIFSIPGMGRVGYEAVLARNYPVLFTVLIFSAVLTMIGILIADILYSVADPRISFTKKK
ncbi:ABC transporter permease [Chitinophagales bacterium]|nr:ABC transporter permease [Chitinophagales bacterium]|tara:strand:- start:1874 stop:3397 length:1524 start_codon:yes stop_codon:yes gene_type:complete